MPEWAWQVRVDWRVTKHIVDDKRLAFFVVALYAYISTTNSRLIATECSLGHHLCRFYCNCISWPNHRSGVSPAAWLRHSGSISNYITRFCVDKTSPTTTSLSTSSQPVSTAAAASNVSPRSDKECALRFCLHNTQLGPVLQAKVQLVSKRKQQIYVYSVGVIFAE